MNSLCSTRVQLSECRLEAEEQLGGGDLLLTADSSSGNNNGTFKVDRAGVS